MEVVVGRAEVALACVGKRLPSELAPIVPSTDDDRVWTHSHAAHRILEAQPIEDSRRVGTYLDAGADLAQFSGLLEHVNIETSASKRQRGGKAANPGADDNYSHVCSARFSSQMNLVSPLFFVILTERATRAPFVILTE